jgi:hypothetical protein
MIRFFLTSKITLSCVAGIAIHRTPCTQTIDHFQIETKAHNSHFGTTTTPSFTFSESLLLRSESPLWECCIPGLGPKGLWHDPTIPVNLPGIFLLRVTLASGETLPTRLFHAKLQGWSAVSTSPPTTLQHPWRSKWHHHAPTRTRIFLGSQVMHSFETRLNPVLAPTSFFFREPHARAVPAMDSSTHLKPCSRSKIWRPSGLTLRRMPYGRGTLMILLRRFL